jgi:cyclase
MPCLLFQNEGLVKTVKFKNPAYVGDAVNAVKIYNEKEVDELVFLDITASAENRAPDLATIEKIASECFMPLTYGGGVSALEQVRQILRVGVEKVSFNSAAINNPQVVSETAKAFGTQCVVVSIDIKKNFWGKYEVYANRGTRSVKMNPVDFARRMEETGAGEIFLTAIDREGTWQGFDLDLIKRVSDAVKIPVIAHGGAGTLGHIEDAVKIGKASAVALGSMVVYQKKGMGVLVNFPKRKDLVERLGTKNATSRAV